MPRRAGTMQKVQVLLQPTEIETQPAYVDSRRVGSVEEDLQRLEDLHLGRGVVAGPLQQHRQGADVVGAEHDVDPGGLLDDVAAVLLGEAAADRDLHAGLGELRRAQVAEVAVEAVVGVLAHGAGVEHDDVRLGVDGHRDVAGVLEQAGDALGIVRVHLAAVGDDLEAARGLSHSSAKFSPRRVRRRYPPGRAARRRGPRGVGGPV
ncbi:hypothetical protein GCM10027610_138220 [Dactylosporangium cerinum]